MTALSSTYSTLCYKTRYRPGAAETICPLPMAVRSKNRNPHISGGRRRLSCRQPACLWPRQLGQRDGRIALFQNAALRGTSVSNLTLDLGLYRRPGRICAETIILSENVVCRTSKRCSASFSNQAHAHAGRLLVARCDGSLAPASWRLAAAASATQSVRRVDHRRGALCDVPYLVFDLHTRRFVPQRREGRRQGVVPQSVIHGVK